MIKKYERQIVNIFLPITLNICFGAQKNRLTERVLLSTHNIWFGWEIRKLIFIYAIYKKCFMFIWTNLKLPYLNNFLLYLVIINLQISRNAQSPRK